MDNVDLIRKYAEENGLWKKLSFDERTLLLSLDCDTLTKVDAIKKKVDLIRFSKNRLFFNDSFPLLYIASGLDFEYPILMGGRQIVMQDIAFDNPDMVAEAERLLSQYPSFEKIDYNYYQLSLEINKKTEKVEIRLDGDDINAYKPFESFGMILEFAGPHKNIFQNRFYFKNLINGGFIINDNPFQFREFDVCSGKPLNDRDALGKELDVCATYGLEPIRSGTQTTAFRKIWDSEKAYEKIRAYQNMFDEIPDDRDYDFENYEPVL